MSITTSYKNKDYSDVSIKFSGREIPCHKLIICTQSKYFEKLCGKGSHFAESDQKIAELKEDDPDAVVGIIRQLYFGSYLFHSSRTDNNWKFHAEVVKAANMYLIPKAADLAAVARMKILDDLTAASEVYDAILDIRAHYADDDALTQKATELQNKHIRTLLLEPRFVESLTSEEVREHFDRLRKMFGNTFEHSGKACKDCGRVFGTDDFTALCDCTGKNVRVYDTDYLVTFLIKE